MEIRKFFAVMKLAKMQRRKSKMKETVEILNELLQNSLLINVLVYAFISEFIIYFGKN